MAAGAMAAGAMAAGAMAAAVCRHVSSRTAAAAARTHVKDFKTDMLRTIRGEPTERIPWLPRMDLWYRANRRAGTLPPEACDATEAQVAEILGAGRHAIVPDFKGDPAPDAEIDRALSALPLCQEPLLTR